MINKKSHISEEDFRRYLENKMTGTERNAFEKELQKYPFEAEAMEGFETVSPENIQNDLNKIKTKILPPKQRNNYRYWAAAASVLLVVSAGVIWMQVKDQNQVAKMAKTKTIEKQEKYPEKSVQIIEPIQANIESQKIEEFPDKKGKVPKGETIVTIEKSSELEKSEEALQIGNDTEISELTVAFNTEDEQLQKSATPKSRMIREVSQPTESNAMLMIEDVKDDSETHQKKVNINTYQTGKKAKSLIQTRDYTIADKAPINAVIILEAPVAAPLPKEITTEDAEAFPVIGIESFEAYLDSTAVLPKSYKRKRAVVKIAFIVNSLGIISDFQNKNSADTLLFKKACEIIQNGSLWIPEIKNEKQTDSAVELKIVFRK